MDSKDKVKTLVSIAAIMAAAWCVSSGFGVFAQASIDKAKIAASLEIEKEKTKQFEIISNLVESHQISAVSHPENY